MGAATAKVPPFEERMSGGSDTYANSYAGSEAAGVEAQGPYGALQQGQAEQGATGQGSAGGGNGTRPTHAVVAAGLITDPTGRVIPEPQTLGLPLSPQFMAADRALEQELQNTLLAIGIEKDTIPLIVEQFKARMKTDQGLEEMGIREGMSDRGMLDSSLTGRTMMEANIPRQRMWQDYSQDVTNRYGELSQQEMEARMGRLIGRDQLIADYAGSLDPTASNIWHGNLDYYEPGGGGNPYFDAYQPGGMWDDYSDYVDQPGPPAPGPGGGPPIGNPGGRPSKTPGDRRGQPSRTGGTRKGRRRNTNAARRNPSRNSSRRRRSNSKQKSKKRGR